MASLIDRLFGKRINKEVNRRVEKLAVRVLDDERYRSYLRSGDTYPRDRHGYDRVTLRAWTKDYNQVAYVADHAGTKVNVQITVSCANGDTFSDSWVDGGSRFRFILGGLGNSRHCDHVFKVDARKDWVVLDLYLYARG